MELRKELCESANRLKTARKTLKKSTGSFDAEARNELFETLQFNADYFRSAVTEALSQRDDHASEAELIRRLEVIDSMILDNRGTALKYLDLLVGWMENTDFMINGSSTVRSYSAA